MSVKQLGLFVEGNKYSKDQVNPTLLEEGYFVYQSDQTYKLSVCGLFVNRDERYIFAPKGFNEFISESKLLSFSRLLFQSLVKYKTKDTPTIDPVMNNLQSRDHIFGGNLFVLMYWLVNDYRDNGFFSRQEPIHQLNGNGRIDWNWTLNRQIPFIVNDQIINFDLYTEKMGMERGSIIASIHRQILSECRDSIGWIFDDFPYDEHYETNMSTEVIITFLRKSLHVSYSTHDIELLENMISYFELKSTTNSSVSIVTNHFYLVWEEMIREILPNDQTSIDNMPTPYWVVNSRKVPSRQIPDIIIHRNGITCIFDAKYYSIDESNVSTFPGWESVVKQLYYFLSLQHKLPRQSIYNVLLVPRYFSSEWYGRLGYTSVEGLENQFGIVTAYFVSMELVMRLYVSHRSIDDKKLDLFLNDIVSFTGLSGTDHYLR